MWRFFLFLYLFVGVTTVMADGGLFDQPGAAIHTNPVIYKAPGVLVSGPRDTYSSLETSGTKDVYTIDEEAADFPNSERRNNQAIAEDEPNQARPDNRIIAQALPNQGRPDNHSLIEQRKEQSADLADNLDPAEILITVAGLTEAERRNFMEILHQSFGQIEHIEPVDFDTGLAGYVVRLDADTKQFAERLEQRMFGGLGLDMIRFRPQQVDYVLQY